MKFLGKKEDEEEEEMIIMNNKNKTARNMDTRNLYYTVLNTGQSQNRAADAIYRSSPFASAPVIRFLLQIRSPVKS